MGPTGTPRENETPDNSGGSGSTAEAPRSEEPRQQEPRQDDAARAPRPDVADITPE